MHIAFTVPLWAMIGFGTVAYPTLGAMVASFLMRASGRRLPGWAVFTAGAAWPVTAIATVAAFPVWLVIWLTKNYGGALKALLSGSGKASGSEDVFQYGQNVRMTKAFGKLVAENHGIVRDMSKGSVQVEFPSIGTMWVPSDYLRLS
jgi:hypothetical protein